jgi:hypothetical protein
LDVRVRDRGRADIAVPDVTVEIRAAGGAGPVKQSKLTDSAGDVIFRLPVGQYHVRCRKNWHVPDPAEQDNVDIPAYGLPQITLVLEELRYYLYVDANRDGDVDDRHEGLDTIVSWKWGARARGAVILCNNDHDDGLAVAARTLDNADGVVNGGNDGTHSVAPLRIFRDGPATPPNDAHHWRARLEVLGGNQDKIRIFDGAAAGSAQLAGAAYGATPAAAHYDFNLRTAAPASMATKDLAMEAVTYAHGGFTGKIQIKLTVSCDVAPSYYTAAEVRVAPWMMPNHRDAARRAYVVDLGPDAVVPPGIIETGNSTFRADLTAALGGLPLTQYPNQDRWMQDCMEIGYSVLPRNAGGNRRHRIEAVMQAYRDFSLFDLKGHARSLLDADFGFLFPGASSASAAHASAIAGGALNTEVASQAVKNVLTVLMEAAKAGRMVADGVSIADGNNMEVDLAANNTPAAFGILSADFQQAVIDAVVAVENAHLAASSAAAARDNAIRDASDAVLALGPPVDRWRNVIARAAAQGGANASNTTTTYDSNGNLECTPPCEVSGKYYPWGRIYYGPGVAPQPFDPATRDFLEKQVVQKPFQLNTDWLLVGHVDEMLTFLPTTTGVNTYRRWKALVASPKRAFEILEHLAPATPVMPGRHLPHGAGWHSVATTVGDIRRGGTATAILDETGAAMTGTQLRDYNLSTVQPNIVRMINTLKTEIGAQTTDIIEVPVIFKPEAGRKAGALTGDMVNMLVVNGRCIVPKPFGPQIAPGRDAFEEDLTAKIRAANSALTVTFVDDWYTYHANMGEIHCGTNTNRYPADLAGWLGGEDAEWWRFTP